MRLYFVCLLIIFILCSCSPKDEATKGEIIIIAPSPIAVSEPKMMVEIQPEHHTYEGAPEVYGQGDYEVAASEPMGLEPVNIPEPKQQKYARFYAAAEQGAVVVGWDGDTRQCIYRKKCDHCGYVLPGRTSTTLNASSTYKSSFSCPQCKQSQQVSIMCSGGK